MFTLHENLGSGTSAVGSTPRALRKLKVPQLLRHPNSTSLFTTRNGRRTPTRSDSLSLRDASRNQETRAMPISRSTTRPDTAGSSEPARRDQRIAFIQFGDFLQSAQSFAHGGPETYYAQRYSVKLVEGLCETYAGVMVLCVDTGPYDQELPSGVRCMGFRGGIWRAEGKRQVVDRLGSWGPTTVVVRTPCRFLIAHCMEAGWRVLPLLADSFLGAGLRGRFSNWRLARLLNRPQIELVANHQVPAARDLVRLVSPDTSRSGSRLRFSTTTSGSVSPSLRSMSIRGGCGFLDRRGAAE
jgi:hypothetical protein